LIQTIKYLIETYEWCAHDPVDRGWSALSKEIAAARELLDEFE
jgi:hypothetical protein